MAHIFAMVFSGAEGWSCGLGTCVGGIPTSIHWSFFLVWLLQIIISIIQYSSSWKYIVNIVVLWGPVLILTVLLHEWGHIRRNRSFGGTCSTIVLWPLGGFSNTNIENGTCLQEFWVSLCGPLMHIPQLAIWTLIMALCAPQGLSYYSSGLNVPAIDEGGAGIWFAQLSKGALDLNIMLFVMNMVIPAYPLDAARMMAALAVHCGMTVVRAAWMLLIAGGILGLAALIYGIISLISGSGMGFFMLFIGVFLLWTTWSLHKTIESQQIIYHPIFRPDCYHPNRATNLSQSVPPTRESMNRPRNSNKQQQQQRPSNSNNDVEMGKGGLPPSKSSASEQKKKNPGAPANKKSKMRPGSIMKLKGIKSRPELNGTRVKLVKRPEGAEGRWEVKLLEDGGSRMSVSDSMLVPV